MKSLVGICLLGGLAGSAQAAFMPGTEIFTNYAGTGTVVENAEARNAGWTDYSTGGGSTPYRFVANGPMTYTETWAGAHDLGTLFLASPGQEPRGTSGNIYIQATSGGSFTLLSTFNNANETVDFYDLGGVSAFGIKVEVTGGAADAYQVGSLGIYKERFDNIAFGRPNFASADAQSQGNVTDQEIRGDSLATQFRSNPQVLAGQEEFTGVTLDGPTQLLGVLVDVSPFDAWAWTNFDVQVFRSGSWQTLGRANVTPASNDLYWVNFGGPELAEAVRLYGSTAGGNNPGEGGGPGQGQIITEIMAFEFVPVPEPMGLSAIAIGACVLLRRRR